MNDLRTVVCLNMIDSVRGSVMVWGGISYDGSADLYVIRNGSLTGIRYRDEILAPIVRLYAGAIGDDLILMDDNARPHRVRIVNEYLQQETIEHMDWPAKSPDLNPIEHAWDILQHRISNRQNQPNSLQELADALLVNGQGFIRLNFKD